MKATLFRLLKIYTAEPFYTKILDAVFLIMLITLLVLKWTKIQKHYILVHYVATGNSTRNADSNSNVEDRFARFNYKILDYTLNKLEERHPGVEFLIRNHDNRFSPDSSKAIYTGILNSYGDTPYIVIDNTRGAHLEVCDTIIRRNQIPVIAINADHNHRNFGPSAVFIGNNDNDPERLALFIKNVMNKDTVDLIYETDYGLSKRYKRWFDEAQIVVGDSIEIHDAAVITPSKGEHFSKRFKEIIKNKRLIVFVAHSAWGRFILEQINDNNDLHVVSSIYWESAFKEELAAQKNNEIIIITSSGDAISKEVRESKEHLKSADSSSFVDINLHEFITRFSICSVIIERMLPRGRDNAIDKTTFFPAIASLQNNAIVTDNDYLKFRHVHKRDTTGSQREIASNDTTNVVELVRQSTFSVFKNGYLTAYPNQFDGNKIIPNVFFGMEIESIYDIDFTAGNFKTDFYYWIKYDSTYSDIESSITFANINDIKLTKLINKTVKNSKIVYKLYKASGVGKQKFDLDNYPLDEHEIAITAQIIDPKAEMRISFDQVSLSNEEYYLRKIDVEDWKPLKYYTTVDNIVVRSSRGMADANLDNTYKNVSFRVLIRRNAFTSIIGIIIPLVIIGFISIGMLFLRDRTFSSIGEATSGLLVTAVLFSLSLTEFTPTTDTLKKTDWIFWITLIVVLINFVITVIYNSVYVPEGREPKLTRKIGKVLGIFYTVAVLVIVFYRS